LKTYIHIILFFCFFTKASFLFSQEPVPYAIDQFRDDPIAAALDSLHSLNLFEKGYAKIVYPKNAKYQFSADSVPRYDESVYAARLAKIDAASPFDLQYNSVVKGYIDMYAFRKRELVKRMMALSQLYFPLFEQQLDKYNLPLELKYLAICESALNPLAKSRVGATGLWQFMYPTGKMFGLKVSSYIDERSDPYKSTVAACEYFKYLYGLFGDWQLVLAAYNGGPGTVNKAIRKSGGKKTYWEIRPFLPKETQGYVPAFIAVNYIMNYTAEHNLNSAIPKKTFLDVDTIAVKKQISFEQIAAVLDIPADDIVFLNPTYKKRIIPFIEGEPSILTLPASKMGAFVNNEEKIYNFINDSLISKNNLIIQPIAEEITKIHVIKSGEYLSTIAKKYGCTVAELKQWNGITTSTVKPGKKLTIYVKKKHTTTNTNAIIKTDNHTGTNTTNQNGFKLYTVQKGDTLFKIAQQNKTTVDALKKLNGFGEKFSLLPGQKIKIAKL